ncbi:MAG: hypothetical protein D6722_29120 [Bacteroidetes bacterium]|nr:MAG: hypothetical protein D6722_29120 [Bacteroidota bacterium]
MIRLLPFLLLALSCTLTYAQLPHEVASYPDEAGFQARKAGMVEAIARQGFGVRSQATSRCPDTGLPVRTWALEGETIYSPYTGRAFTQGPTGYFGPKERDSLGRIVAFGGDPLKYDLPPAAATLYLDSTRADVLHFLSIPGNMRQQYHFAAKNWARFYGLNQHLLSEAWKADFQAAVAQYREARRPSDGPDREHLDMSRPHDLVGQPGELLGGNTKDGGTENHKTMWRSSALLYAQWFPDTAQISYYPVPEADSLVRGFLFDYLARCLQRGNGEYHSPMYYPHSINAYLNLYDFAEDPEIKELARAQLDFYLATYALKSLHGVLGGPARRGYLSYADGANDMERLLWLWTGAGPWDLKPEDLGTKDGLHPATTTYRPNQIIWNLLRKDVALPYEVQIAHPDYHIDLPNRHQETDYVSEHFVLGSTTIHTISNPGQQVVWSLVAEGAERPLHFGGGHPRYNVPSGHSPYTQTLQKGASLILMSGQNEPRTFEGNPHDHIKSWYANAGVALEPTVWPEQANRAAWTKFVKEAPQRAESWLWIPRAVDERRVVNGRLFVRAGQTYLIAQPLGEARWLDIPEDSLAAWAPDRRDPLKAFPYYHVWVVSGPYSGYTLDVAEAADYEDFEAFIQEASARTKLDTRRLAQGLVRYRTLSGDRLQMQYEPHDLKCTARINGRKLRYDRWDDEGVYQSPYVQLRDGVLRISDGRDSYEIEMTGPQQVEIRNRE